MSHERWYEPTENGPKGEPCFIPYNGTSPAPIKRDYVYCPQGVAGKGYYSLMCHNSYVNLNRKLKSLTPQAGACPCCASKEVRDTLDRYDDVKRVVYMRQLPFQPNDKLASDIVMGQAKATADKVYNFTQGEQLVFNAINVATI